MVVFVADTTDQPSSGTTPSPTPSRSAGASPRPTASAGAAPKASSDVSRFKAMGATGGNAGSAFSLGTSAYNGPTVYFGNRAGPGGRGTSRLPGERENISPIWLTPEQAYGAFFSIWTPEQRRDLRAKGILSGQLRETDGELETAAWWKALVQHAAQLGAGGNQISPMDLANGYLASSGYGMTDQERFKQQRGSFPAGAMFDSSGKYMRKYRDGQFIVDEISGTREYVGPKIKTTTDTRVDFTDPATARALTTSIFQQLVGRDPGAGELGQFAAALQAAEKSSPTTVNTTATYNSLGEVVSQQSTSYGGLTAEGKAQLMKEKLKETKEAGVYQAATTYSDALKQAIWGGPGA